MMSHSPNDSPSLAVKDPDKETVSLGYPKKVEVWSEQSERSSRQSQQTCTAEDRSTKVDTGREEGYRMETRNSTNKRKRIDESDLSEDLSCNKSAVNTDSSNLGANSATVAKTDANKGTSTLASKKKKPRSSKKKKGGGKPFNTLEAKWNEMFERLKSYKLKHGDCLVPNRYEKDKSLGAWVSTQRRQFKILTSASSESTPMTPQRAQRLNSIGFVWATKDPRHTPWERRYEQLLQFYFHHGHCLVPIGYKENVQLANWVSTQRQEYKCLREGRPSRLTPERIQRLEDLQFVWDAQRGAHRSRLGRYRSMFDNSETNSESTGVSSILETHRPGSGASTPPVPSVSDNFSPYRPTVLMKSSTGRSPSSSPVKTLNSYPAKQGRKEDPTGFKPTNNDSSRELQDPRNLLSKYQAQNPDVVVATQRGLLDQSHPQNIFGNTTPNPEREPAVASDLVGAQQPPIVPGISHMNSGLPYLGDGSDLSVHTTTEASTSRSGVVSPGVRRDPTIGSFENHGRNPTLAALVNAPTPTMLEAQSGYDVLSGSVTGSLFSQANLDPGLLHQVRMDALFSQFPLERLVPNNYHYHQGVQLPHPVYNRLGNSIQVPQFTSLPTDPTDAAAVLTSARSQPSLSRSQPLYLVEPRLRNALQAELERAPAPVPVLAGQGLSAGDSGGGVLSEETGNQSLSGEPVRANKIVEPSNAYPADKIVLEARDTTGDSEVDIFADADETGVH